MKKKFDIFDMHTGKFIRESDDEYNNIYEQFLHDLDMYQAEQEVVNRMMKQHISIDRWYHECLD